MIETHTCIVVLCDACGDGWGDDEGAWHFTSLEAVRRELVAARIPDPDVDPDEPFSDRRWQIEDGKPVMCPDCRMAAACAAEGHVWSDWAPGRSHGTEMVSSRVCWRCSKFETNIPQMVDQMVAEVNPS